MELHRERAVDDVEEGGGRQLSLSLSLSHVPPSSPLPLYPIGNNANNDNSSDIHTGASWSHAPPPSTRQENPSRHLSSAVALVYPGLWQRSNAPTDHILLRDDKCLTIPPPFRWALDRRAMVHSLETILAMGITSVEGWVQCRRCDHRAVFSYGLEEYYRRVEKRIASVVSDVGRFCHKAPSFWREPRFQACPSCLQENCMRPVVVERKRSINWLFMFLGETIGDCNLGQLRYFCKHNSINRTGSKGQLLLHIYLQIHKQLDPSSTLPPCS